MITKVLQSPFLDNVIFCSLLNYSSGHSKELSGLLHIQDSVMCLHLICVVIYRLGPQLQMENSDTFQIGKRESSVQIAKPNFVSLQPILK